MMNPEDVGHLAIMGEASISLLGIASCHTNGQVREPAVQELGKSSTGGEPPFLLIRVNDWVPQIRSAAARNLSLNRVRTDYVSHLATWMPLVLRLRYAARDDHSAITEAVRQLFASVEAREALGRGFQSEDQLVRRFCFQVALNSTVHNLLFVLRRTLESPDPQVRREALQKLPAILPSAEAKEFVPS
jgi:hypothetical protein